MQIGEKLNLNACFLFFHKFFHGKVVRHSNSAAAAFLQQQQQQQQLQNLITFTRRATKDDS